MSLFLAILGALVLNTIFSAGLSSIIGHYIAKRQNRIAQSYYDKLAAEIARHQEHADIDSFDIRDTKKRCH